MLQPKQLKNASLRQRGVAMIIALFLIVLILIVSIAVLANASNSAGGSLGVQTKNQTFNAAETGLDTAIYQIDANQAIADGTPHTGATTVDGYTYNWEVVKNNFGKGPTSATDPDPASTPAVAVPANTAYLAGWASSITGGRTVYVEAMVIPGPPIPFTPGAIVSGATATISHEPIHDNSGKHSADIRADQIGQTGGGTTPDGNSYATCNVAGCNTITGYDGSAYIDQPAASFLTAAQLAAIKAAALTQAQKGGSNVYVTGDWTSGGTWGASGANCTVYINGNVSMGGSTNLANYCATTVITGNLTISGSAQYTIQPTSTAHAIYVFGTGGVTFRGNTGTIAGFVYSANGPVTLDGSGCGDFTGMLYSPYNITELGGGCAHFFYDPAVLPPPPPNPNVLPVSQWEY